MAPEGATAWDHGGVTGFQGEAWEISVIIIITVIMIAFGVLPYLS